MRIVFLTDLHWGMPQIPPSLMAKNLDQYFYPRLDSSVDLVLFGGDMFDTALTLDSRASLYAMEFKTVLLYLARKYGFPVRGVRGTFTHDRNQCDHLLIVPPEEQGKPPVIDIHAAMTLEYVAGLNVLFVPDNMTCKDLLLEVRQLLDSRGLDRADVAVHHGFMTHLVPAGIPHIPKHTHSAKEWEQLVRGPVFNGHVHAPSVYGTVVSGGSFERWQYGEEEAKGFFVVDYDISTNNSKFEFVENKGATRFITVTFDGLERDALGKKLAECVTIVDSSTPLYIRAIVSDNTAAHVLRGLAKQYDNVTLTRISRELAERQAVAEVTIGRPDLPALTAELLCAEIIRGAAEKGVHLDPEYVGALIAPAGKQTRRESTKHATEQQSS